MTTISAKSLKASILALDPSKRGDTFELRYPRAIHAEFMTHRVFSRNAASSRAIPVERLIEDVMTDPFIPLHWGKNQKGMQAFETTDTKVIIRKDRFFNMFDACFEPVSNEKAWLYARDQAVKVAQAFSDAGYHKQVVNRLLEPWAHINVVMTTSQLSNFFALRDHPDAEPHIRILAGEIKNAYQGAKTAEIKPGQWHMPYTDVETYREAFCLIQDDLRILDFMRKVSVARCASVSYKTVDGQEMTIDRASLLHDKLIASQPLHASPAEHQFTCDERDFAWKNPHLGGNLGPGFIQYRKILPNECL